MRKSIFDELEDVFDDIELDTEDKVIFSPEMAKLIREEISKLPIGKIVSKVVARAVTEEIERQNVVKSNLSKEIRESKDEIKKESARVAAAISELNEKFRKKYDDLKNGIINQPKYEFGGYAPPNPVNSSNNTVLTNTNGTWDGIRWIPSSGGGLAPGTFTVTNNTPAYTFDSTNSSLDEISQILATLVRKLQGEI